MNDNWNLLFGTIVDCSCDIIEAYYTMYGHEALVTSGPAGLVAEIIIVTLGLILDDNCSIHMKNSINVSFAREVDSLVFSKASNAQFKHNGSHELISVIPVNDPGEFSEMFVFDAFAKHFAEKEYLGYLDDKKWFIYKTSNSKSDAKNNMNILNDIICKYSGSDISIDE